MIRTGVVGFGGRMGSLIARSILERPDFILAGALEDNTYPSIGRDAGEVLGYPKSGTFVSKDLNEAFETCECIIDFTFPEVTLAVCSYAAEKGKAMVIGSTGFKEEQRKAIEVLSKKIPVVMSPNMSIGVNVLLKIVSQMAGLLDEGYDAEIVEAHHRLKKDAPSGTALALALAVSRGRGVDMEKHACYERHGIIGVRPVGEIGIQTVRAGDIVGEHTVMFAGPGERIEIAHKAHSRENFARGAIKAAGWVMGKQPGLYSMMDVLGIGHEDR